MGKFGIAEVEINPLNTVHRIVQLPEDLVAVLHHAGKYSAIVAMTVIMVVPMIMPVIIMIITVVMAMSWNTVVALNSAITCADKAAVSNKAGTNSAADIVSKAVFNQSRAFAVRGNKLRYPIIARITFKSVHRKDKIARALAQACTYVTLVSGACNTR